MSEYEVTKGEWHVWDGTAEDYVDRYGHGALPSGEWPMNPLPLHQLHYWDERVIWTLRIVQTSLDAGDFDKKTA